MDMQKIATSPAVCELETEILLHINERLFHSGGVTSEMYEKAKEMILKL